MANRGSWWSEEETLCLLGIWREQNIQDQLDGTVRNNIVMRKIMEMMAASGYERTILQIKNKIKKLRVLFRCAEDNNRTSGRGRKTCRYYNELEDILGGRPDTAPVAVVASVELEVPETSDTEDGDILNMDTDSGSEVEDATLGNLHLMNFIAP